MDDFFIIGVVVSRNNLFYCLMYLDKILKQGEIINETSAIRVTLSSLLKEFHLSGDQVLICAEHSGQFNYPLIYSCESESYKLCMENPKRIKIYCTGLQQGKSYRLTPKQIAVYASRNKDKINLCHQPISEVEHLKQLHIELEMLEVDSAKMHSQLFDKKNYMSEEVFNINANRLINLIRGLEDAIETIKNEIKCIFAVNSFLSEQMELLTSIEGVNVDIALKMIVETDAFTRFENCRQFCSHVGIAPVKKVLKVNEYSTKALNPKPDKGIKTMLNQAAISAINGNENELKTYYTRKLNERKDEKIVLNAIRVKLVARMFAVIKNNHLYRPVIREAENLSVLKKTL